MHSSISSSEISGGIGACDSPPDTAHRPNAARDTAADRPGVAQPVPVRPVPEQPWGKILLGVVALLALLVAVWESYWRAYGAKPGYQNTYGLWALQRQRIDSGEGNATVLVGASRVYYDIQLPVWERLDGQRPIQLSFEGTSPLTYLEDLASDTKFVGRALVGIEPDLFFSGFEYRGGAVRYTRKQSPAQYLGQQLSMRLIEPYLAFEDPDFALKTVLERQAWPKRPGRRPSFQPRKLGYHEADRNSYVWDKVSDDPEYRELWQRIWRASFEPGPDDPTPAEALQTEREQIARAARVVARLRARGVQVLFVRMPSDGEYLAYENRDFPRARTWTELLAATGAPGIHFEDYPGAAGIQFAGMVALDARGRRAVHCGAARDHHARLSGSAKRLMKRHGARITPTRSGRCGITIKSSAA